MNNGVLPIDEKFAEKFASMDVKAIRDTPDATEQYISADGHYNRMQAARKQKDVWCKWNNAIKRGELFFHQNHYPHNELVTGNAYKTDIMNLSRCHSCNRIAVWVYGKLVYPISQRSEAPFANLDMPDDIKKYYNEAADILARSPRGAAALLRLAVEKFCNERVEEGNNLNEKIGNLVQRGLSAEIQQALDVLRVIGNNAVHPGQIELDDDKVMALGLFECLNAVVEDMISKPERMKRLYGKLPPKDQMNIAKRDGKNK